MSEQETVKISRTLRRARRDVVALGIAVAAIVMFVGIGGSVLPQVFAAWTGRGTGPSVALMNALLLNIALVIFGWRRYRELTTEISERTKAEERARQLAETDPLTGLLNRRSMPQAIDAMIAESQREGSAVAVLMIDLDNFKQVNDVAGHAAGDALLKELTERIKAKLPRGVELARLGGDEFACAMPLKSGNPVDADKFASALLAICARNVGKDQAGAVPVSLSIGIATTEQQTVGGNKDNAASLLHQADIAMYQAKKRGKGNYVWFAPEMESELRLRHDLENGIREGIARGEFVPYYEQQRDLDTGDLVGFEMLARWRSPSLGLVSPDIFIPIAEEIGMITELSENLILQALRDAREWAPKLTVSVNISPVQLRDPWFSQRLLKLLVQENFPAHRLEIEITESCLHEDVGAVRTALTSLKNQGVRTSLDDFGTGYSSLAQLNSLPFDRIKIDRSFVMQMTRSAEDTRMVNAIINLGGGLNLPMTAEGIEDDAIRDQLKGLGQMKGQGFLYGQPEDREAVRKRLLAEGLLTQDDGTASPSKDTDPDDEAASIDTVARKTG